MADQRSLEFVEEGRFLDARLRAYAEQAVSGRPGLATARAIAAANPRPRRRFWLPSLWLPASTRRAPVLGFAAAVTLLILLALAAVALVPGLRPTTPFLRPVRPLLVIQGSRVLEVSVDDGSTTDVGAGTAARWSPDGSRIAVLGAGGVSVLDRSGAGRRVLSVDPCQLGPWSPDGRTLLAACGAGNASPIFELLHVDDGTVQALGGLKPYKDFGGGSWSPDGSRLAIPVNGHDIAVIGSAPGAQPEFIHRGGPWLVRWSPDGALIAYVDGSGINVMSPDGTNDRVLVGGASPCELRWSPDGRSVAFTAPSGGCPAGGSAGIRDARVVDVATGAQQSIASPVAGQQVVDLAWSADAQRLAIVVGPVLQCGADPAPRSLWIVNRDGSGARQVVASVDCEWPDAGGPDW
jgi:dipeptidyl aminopeptidase/acylaminoacyl peptidase